MTDMVAFDQVTEWRSPRTTNHWFEVEHGVAGIVKGWRDRTNRHQRHPFCRRMTASSFSMRDPKSCFDAQQTPWLP
jgi:hypothetical protein